MTRSEFSAVVRSVDLSAFPAKLEVYASADTPPRVGVGPMKILVGLTIDDPKTGKRVPYAVLRWFLPHEIEGVTPEAAIETVRRLAKEILCELVDVSLGVVGEFPFRPTFGPWKD